MSQTIIHAPELLLPAGTIKSMRYAFAYGADAIYAGQARYSLRVRNNEFSHEKLAQSIAEAHALGKKFYVVANIAPHNSKVQSFIQDISPIVAMQPDAIIMSDPGLIMLLREAFPHVHIHLSVQANAVNWATVRFWQQQGITRVILSRELSLDEVAEIKQQVPGIELEIFVHGAICMAYSGRCLLSGYITRRDSNQGVCANVCRWKYKAQPAAENELGQLVQEGQVAPTLGLGPSTQQGFLLEETTRPNEYLSAFEDEHGTYIMNARDLKAVEHVAELSRMGIDSLKIEGRTKSFFYCARTAQVYRKAIDDAAAGKDFDANLVSMLDSLANRGYTDGFLRRQNHAAYQNYKQGSSAMGTQRFVGELTGETRNGLAEVIVKNRFELGDTAELMTPQENFSFPITHLENKAGAAIRIAPGDGHVVYISVPEAAKLDFALLLRDVPAETSTLEAS